METGGVIYERGGISNRIDSVDTVVSAAGLEADHSMVSIIEDAHIPYHVIGDAKQPGNITSAIREGYEVAIKI